MNRGTPIGVWFAVLATVAGGGALGGVSITISTGALLLVACLVPPAIMLMVWRGAPPQLAELLYTVDRHVRPSPNRHDT